MPGGAIEQTPRMQPIGDSCLNIANLAGPPPNYPMKGYLLPFPNILSAEEVPFGHSIAKLVYQRVQPLTETPHCFPLQSPRWSNYVKSLSKCKKHAFWWESPHAYFPSNRKDLIEQMILLYSISSQHGRKSGNFPLEKSGEIVIVHYPEIRPQSFLTLLDPRTSQGLKS